MIKIKNIIVLPSLYIIALTGCFFSTSIYKKQFIKNDSTFVERDVGAEVLIGLNNGEEHTGELLHVNDSTIILSNEYGLSEGELQSTSSNISIIQNREIKSIWVLGKNNHLIGLAIGLGVGALLIKTSNQVKYSEWNQAYTGLLCIPAGFLSAHPPQPTMRKYIIIKTQKILILCSLISIPETVAENQSILRR